MCKFNIGDVVTLKGYTEPKMVVEKTGETMSGRELYKCIWFDETNNIKEFTFYEESLHGQEES